MKVKISEVYENFSRLGYSGDDLKQLVDAFIKNYECVDGIVDIVDEIDPISIDIDDMTEMLVSTLKLMEIECPKCGKRLSIEDKYYEDGFVKLLCHCEECLDGIDSDWLATLETDGNIEVKRYFFG